MMNNTLPSKLLCCFLLFFHWGLVYHAKATSLSGTYTINPSLPASLNNFQNFRSAIQFLTSDSTRTDGGPSNSAPFGVSSAVVFDVAQAVYNERVMIKGKFIPGLSAINTIVFNGGTGTATITANVAAPVFILDQCSYITLRNLTMVNTNTTNPQGVRIIGNTTTTNNGTGCRIKHCSISLNNLSNSISTAVLLTDSVDITGYSKTWADSVEIDSNMITGGTYGIVLNGAANGLYNHKIMVRSNTISKVRYGAVFYTIYNGLDFMYNSVSDIQNDGPTNTSEYLIEFNNCRNTGSDPVRIIANRINANLGAIYINNNSGTAGTPFQIYNNMIRARKVGITIVQMPSLETYFQVYHNTIYVFSDLTSSYYSGSAFVYIPQRKAGQLKCYNNIFAVGEAKNGEQTLSVAAEVLDTASLVNYNVYYNPSGKGGALLRRNDSTYSAGLTNILTDQIGGDSSAIFKPPFVSNDDLHITSNCLFTGLDLTTEVPFDIDGEPRSGTPQPGCDEFISQSLDLFAESIVSPLFPASPGTHDLRVRVRNTGYFPVSSFVAGYNLNGTVVSQAWSGLLNPCDTVTVTFTGADQILVDSSAPVKLTVYVSDPNASVDMVSENDTLQSKQLKGEYTIGETLCDYTSFTDAVNDLYKHGICDNVHFKVKPGTYMEQVKIVGSRISGISSSSRITFEGEHTDSVIVTGSFAQQGIVMIQNTRYITFRKMTLNNTHPVSGAGVMVVGDILGKNYNGTGCAVKQCKVNLTASDAKGVYVTSELAWSLATNGYIQADSVEIDSNTIIGGSHGIYIAGAFADSTVNVGIKVRYNNISNASYAGIYLHFINEGVDVLYNTVHGDNCIAGIELRGCTTSSSRAMKVNNNKVNVIADYGINIASSWALKAATPMQIYNNEVVNAINGIYYNTNPGTPNPAATYAEVFHNSVNVNRTGSGNAYSFYFNNALTPGGLMIKNNIFAVTATSGIGVPVYLATAITAPGNCDYNNYYNVTGPTLIFRTSAYSKADFQAPLSGGIHSVSMKPEWVSLTDMHLTGGCKEVGVNLAPAIVGDVNDTLRSVSPSMGCYEYSALSNDLAIDALTAPAFPIITGIQDVSIRLINNGSGTITSAVITYQLNGSTPVTSYWGGSLAPCDTAIVIFPSLPIGGTNTLKVYCSDPNGFADEYTGNDTLTTTISGSLAGTYTIGSAPSDYPTFAAAISDLQLFGLGGPVIFNVKSGSYNGQLEIAGGINGLSPVNTITFQSLKAHHDSVKIAFTAGSSSNFVVRLNNVNYITIRNMTFEALDDNYARVIEFVGSSSYNKIEGCRIISKSISGFSGTDRCGLYAHSTTGRVNTITNNLFENGQTAVHWWGISETNLSDSIIIDSNTFLDHILYAIEPKFTRNMKIRNNVIQGPATRGIYPTYCDESVEITGNNISLTNNGYGIFMVLCDGSFAKKNIVANNSIIMSGLNPVSVYGIYSISGSYQLFAHNSVLVTGGSSITGYGGYFQYSGVNVSNEVINNIFTNTNGGVALFFYTTLGTCRSDYNLLYTTGSIIAERLAAYPNPTRIADLITWRTLTGQDKHSVSYRPAFTSPTNLVPNPADSAIWAINGRAVHIDSTLLAKDKTGQLRPLTRAAGVADLGAFECTPVSIPPLCQAIPATMPATSVTDTTQLFLFASDTVAKITWAANSVIPAEVKVRQYTGVLPPVLDGPQHNMYMYATIDLPGVTSSPLYSASLYYQDEWNGTNPNERDLKAISKTPSTPWTLDTWGTIDTVRNIITKDFGYETSMIITGTDISNPLPVKLLNIEANWVQSAVRVSWATASELNTSHFEVQQSTDGKSFAKLARVNATGNSSSIRYYEMVDQSVQSNKADVFYYRLKMVDRDGSIAYSKVVSVKRNQSRGVAEAKVFPNPFTGQLFMSIPVSEETLVSWSLSDISGMQLLQQSQWIAPGKSTIEVPSTDLLSGMYFLQLEYNGMKKTEKVIKY